ncbi:MAG: hypothetical protein JW828_14450, partial [Sedimentisphaerales bacterium]|nr:hypothetical protein [Sedimentisphaerales bacterium]
EEPIDMEQAAEYCRQTIERFLPLASGNVININIPRLSEGKPKGVKVVPHAATGFREGYEAKTGEDGQIIYTFTNGVPQHADHTEGTDTRWLADGYITVTALRLDMNDSLRNDQLRRLFER